MSIIFNRTRVIEAAFARCVCKQAFTVIFIFSFDNIVFDFSPYGHRPLVPQPAPARPIAADVVEPSVLNKPRISPFTFNHTMCD